MAFPQGTHYCHFCHAITVNTVMSLVSCYVIVMTGMGMLKVWVKRELKQYPWVTNGTVTLFSKGNSFFLRVLARYDAKIIPPCMFPSIVLLLDHLSKI